MPLSPPPNAALAELAAVLGVENVRPLVHTYLGEFPAMFAQLTGGERRTRHRIVHSMKSGARVMGAAALSDHMAVLEARLARPDGPDVSPQDLAVITAHFEAIAPPLRAFAGA